MSMEQITNLPDKKNEENKFPVMMSIFDYDYKKFTKAVDEALIEGERGGFEVGTGGFIRYIVGNTDLSKAEIYKKAKAEIMKMVGILQDSKQKKQNKAEKPDENHFLIEESRKMLEDEGERSGFGGDDDVEEYHQD